MTLRAARIFLLLAPLVLFALASPSVPADTPGVDSTLHTLWVATTDSSGSPAVPGAQSRLEVAVGTAPGEVASVVPAGSAPRVVVFFDLDLLTEGAARGSAIALSELARDLVELGPVEIVLSERDSMRFVPVVGGDAQAVNAAFEGLALRQTGGDRLARLREQFVAALGPDSRNITQTVGEAIAEEVAVVRGARERLALFAADAGPQPGAVLLLVTGPAEEDPRGFYRRALAGVRAGLVDLDAVPRPVVLPSADEVGRILAAYGWTLLTLDPGRGGGQALLAGPVTLSPSVRDQLPSPLPAAPGESQKAPPRMVGIKLGEDDEEPEEPVFDPGLGDSTAWRTVAEATGGELFGGEPLGLGGALARLRARSRMSFPGPALGPGEVRPVVVSAAGDAKVQAPRWLGRPPLESVAAIRVRQLLEGEELEGELPLEASLELAGPRLGRLVVRVPAESSVSLQPAGARWTLGIGGEEGEPLVFTRPAAATESGLLLFDLTLPDGASSRVAVMGEDLATGRFGLALATVIEAGAALELADSPSGPRAVRIEPLDRPFVFGPTSFSARVASAEVRRVEFLLDGEPVGVRTAAPWVLSIDLGEVPRRRDLEVVATSADGRELGRDWLRVNEGSGAFRVRIVEPRAAVAGQSRVGPVDVAAEVVAPEGSAISRVEFYWNATVVATRFQAPWRQRVMIPPEEPGGFLRVVAHLVDGSSTEDVLFPNAAGSGERIDVELVEVYVAVTDDGRAVPGLAQGDFRVFEEGVPQEVASFAATDDLPITVGLALDSSASMFIKLPLVGRAAGEFVTRFLRPRDRAFVVGFGAAPRLAQASSADGEILVEAIAGLEPDGQTAIWEGIVFSLVQLQGASGQKALVVYTDGADEDETFSYETALRFARRFGVPVYVILANNEIVRTEGRALGVRRFVSRVRRLAESVGGRVYLAHYDDDLAKIYTEIGRDLRSQYLLTFYPKGEARGWRRLKVTAGSGREVRAASGYFR